LSSNTKVMAAKLTRMTYKIAIELHLVAESYTICSSPSRLPVKRLLDTPSYVGQAVSLRSSCLCMWTWNWKGSFK